MELISCLRVIAPGYPHADLTPVHAFRQCCQRIRGIDWISEIRHQDRSAELNRDLRSDRSQKHKNISVAQIVVYPNLSEIVAVSQRCELDPLRDRIPACEMGGKLQTYFTAENSHTAPPLRQSLPAVVRTRTLVHRQSTAAYPAARRSILFRFNFNSYRKRSLR